MARLIARFRLWWAVRVAMRESARIERMARAHYFLGAELARLRGEMVPDAVAGKRDEWGDFERNDREAFEEALRQEANARAVLREIDEDEDDGYDEAWARR